jgi:hypothetical protein
MAVGGQHFFPTLVLVKWQKMTLQSCCYPQFLCCWTEISCNSDSERVKWPFTCLSEEMKTLHSEVICFDSTPTIFSQSLKSSIGLQSDAMHLPLLKIKSRCFELDKFICCKVLWNDSLMTGDELQKLSFYLCHLYSRCSRWQLAIAILYS